MRSMPLVRFECTDHLDLVAIWHLAPHSIVTLTAIKRIGFRSDGLIQI